MSGCGAGLNQEPSIAPLERQASLSAKAATSGTGEARPQGDNDREPLIKTAEEIAFKNTPGSGAYKIGPLDVLDIAVFKVPELSKSVQVSEAGTISLPLAGQVAVAGKSAQEVERDLEAKLGAKFIRNPQVTVYVKEYNSQRVTVEGAVRKPGIFPLKGKTTLLQVLAMAESPDKETASSIVAVFRTIDGRRYAARFDIEEIRSGRAEDPIMRQGDVVIVDTSTSKLVFNNFVRMLPTAAAFVPLL